MPDRNAVQVDRAPGVDLGVLYRTNPERARALMRGLAPEIVAAHLQALEPAEREPLLAVCEQLEQVVPLLSEMDLLSTLRAVGLHDAGWLLEFASTEQRVACVDLDCWQGVRLSPQRLGEWVDALVAAGPRALTAAFDELDPELWVLVMRHMADFAFAEFSDEPPPDGLTEDGVVYYQPHSEDDEDRLAEILRTAFSESPRHYWQLVYGAAYESQVECEEYALRWQRARLNDLGFPDRDQAMRLYKPLRVRDVPVMDAPEVEREDGADTVWLPEAVSGALVGRALAELPAGRASELLGYVLAVGNAVAIADRLPLGDPHTIELAIRKTVRGIDRGLAALSRARSESLGRVLDSTTPADLFRVGATLDPALRPGVSIAGLVHEDAALDWDREIEVAEPERSGEA